MITRTGTCWQLLLAASLLATTDLRAATPTPEEMWKVIQEQQKVIDELKAKLAVTDEAVKETNENVELTADRVEEVAVQQRMETDPGKRTVIGGYGELHYNNLDDDETTDGDDSLEQTDFHRFIIYLGHEFNERIRFFSELELEHSLVAGDGSSAGEVELEQAWLEMDLADRHHLRAGLDILPIGIINTTHEPNTFYGVERNRVESEIIPTTWWEAGLGVHGELAPGWNYNTVLHSGLVVPTTGEPFRVREGRLKVSEAKNQDAAFTGQLRYTGIPGLEVGFAGQYQRDVTGTADDFDIEATLLEAHLDWRHSSGAALRALYARWDFGSDDGLDPGTYSADTLDGWYVEPAYRFALPAGMLGELGLFARYGAWEERNRLPAFRYEEFEQLSLGFNWWPHARLAVKFDAQWEGADGTVDRLLDGINLGVGYQF